MLRKLCALTLILPFCAGLFALALKAEDSGQDKEAKEAKEEDEKESRLSETDRILAIRSVRGILSLGDQGTGNTEVIGALAESAEKIYLVKLEDKGLMQRLIPYNLKQVTLRGKVRNQEKYLIVSAIDEATGGAAPDRKKRGGI